MHERRGDHSESKHSERRRSRDYDITEKDPTRRERRTDSFGSRDKSNDPVHSRVPGSILPPPRSVPPPPGGLNRPPKSEPSQASSSRQGGMMAYPDTMKEAVAPAKPNPPKKSEESKDKSKNVSKDKKDTTIFVNNLPSDLMDIVSVSGHFAKYGKVVNISVNQKRRSAMIKFARPSEANQASQMPLEGTPLESCKIAYNPTSAPQSDPSQFKVKPGDNKIYESDAMKKRKEE